MFSASSCYVSIQVMLVEDEKGGQDYGTQQTPAVNERLFYTELSFQNT